MICDINGDDLLRIFNNNKCIGNGVYGMVYEYDDTTLIKIYYKDIFRFFTSKNIDDLNNEVDINLYVESEMLEIRSDYVTKLNRLVNIGNCLNRADCSLMKGIVLYHGYPIGILLNYYKGYVNLGEIFEKLDGQSQLIVINKVKFMLFRLFEYGVYPLDLKESNVLVKPETLDVQFIDLDGLETRYEDEDYIKRFSYIKEDAIKSFEIMEQRLKAK